MIFLYFIFPINSGIDAMGSTIKVFWGLRTTSRFQNLEQTFSQEPDMEIVGKASDAVEVLVKAGITKADAVITEISGDKDPGLCSHLLTEYPEIKVFAISDDEDRVVIYEKQDFRKREVSLSPGKLIGIVRSSINVEEDTLNDIV
jgi:DNA-binding NarL/FixJ family response regulator